MVTLEGSVTPGPDPTRLAAAMVESTTEYDYAELPAELRDELTAWALAFNQWADVVPRFLGRPAPRTPPTVRFSLPQEDRTRNEQHQANTER